MKKIICLLMCLLSVFCFTACGAEQGNVIEGTAKTETNKDIVDLSKMSTTIVYSELTNIMQQPDKYIGKTIKLKGQFKVNSSDTGTYYLCLVADATACCQQGMEFVLKGNPEYPNGYPAVDSEITVEGKFATYQEGDGLYCHLEDAEIL